MMFQRKPHPGAFSTTKVDDYGNPVAVGCYDCGMGYNQPAWIEAVVPDDVWREISPSHDEGGLLCIQCIALRCAERGIEDVPVKITAGPLRGE